MRRLIALVVIAGPLLFAAVLSGPIPSALAHATLVSSVPAAGAVERATPDSVTLRFSEAVEGRFGSLRVYGPGGERVDEGPVRHPGGDSRSLSVAIDAGHRSGSLAVSWRVLSVDGHVVAGGYVFSIGKRSSLGTTFSDPGFGSEEERSATFGVGAARFLQFGAIAVALGALVFLLGVWSQVVRSRLPGCASADPAVRSRLVRLIRGAGVVGCIASLLGLVSQGALASGKDLLAACDFPTLSATLGTRFGTVWLMALAAWAVIAVGARLAAAGGRHPLQLAIPLSFVAALPALSGHSAARSALGVAAPVNVLHVAAMSAWVGGVVALLVAVAPVARRLGRDGKAVFAAAVGRFSTVALVSVGVVLITGIAQTLIAVDSPERLLGTSYGKAILAKACLLGLLVTIGAAQRRLVIPSLAKGGEEQISVGRCAGLLVAETSLFALALVATSALASFSPVEEWESGPVSRQLVAGPTSVSLTVDPARVGVNGLHVFLVDSRTGERFSRASSVTLSESASGGAVGPFTQRARRAGPAHWIAPGVVIPGGGSWRVRVDVRVGEFDQYSATAEVPISRAASVGGPPARQGE